MGATKYIDFTTNGGLVSTVVSSSTDYICNQPIILSDDYLYYETDIANTWEYNPCVLAKESDLILEDTNYSMTYDHLLPDRSFIWTHINHRMSPNMYLGAATRGSISWLTSGGTANLTRIGICFNNKEILFVNNDNLDPKILRMTYPDYVDLTGNIRVICGHGPHSSGSINNIYTSEEYLTLTDILQENGITNFVSLYTYFRGEHKDNSKNILKVY